VSIKGAGKKWVEKRVYWLSEDEPFFVGWTPQQATGVVKMWLVMAFKAGAMWERRNRAD
jgi:hypothetical protein